MLQVGPRKIGAVPSSKLVRLKHPLDEHMEKKLGHISRDHQRCQGYQRLHHREHQHLPCGCVDVYVIACKLRHRAACFQLRCGFCVGGALSDRGSKGKTTFLLRLCASLSVVCTHKAKARVHPFQRHVRILTMVCVSLFLLAHASLSGACNGACAQLSCACTS